MYVGSEQGIERKLVKDLGVRFEAIKCGKLRRYFSWENFKDFFKVPVGIWQARSLLKKFRPKVVFSTGGYVSLPVVLAGWTLKIPVISHELDVVPGLANKISAKFAKKISLSFSESEKYFEKYKKKIVISGSPVRKDIDKGSEEKGYKLTGFDKHRPIVLVMGGSQGAQQINTLVRNNLGELLKKFQIIHLCGRGNLDISAYKRGYKQFEYLNDELKDVYAISEIVISRGGANSLAEIAYLKKKCLVIPLIIGSRGDQVDNAKVFGKKFGWSVLEGEFSNDDFLQALELLKKNSKNTSKLQNGVSKIAEEILSFN